MRVTLMTAKRDQAGSHRRSQGEDAWGFSHQSIAGWPPVSASLASRIADKCRPSPGWSLLGKEELPLPKSTLCQQQSWM